MINNIPVYNMYDNIGYFREDLKIFIPNENFTKLLNYHLKENSEVKVMINIPKEPVNKIYHTYISFAEKPTSRTLIHWNP